MLDILFFIFNLKLIVPAIVIGLIIYFISKYSGIDAESIMTILLNGTRNFVGYINSCLMCIKNFF